MSILSVGQQIPEARICSDVITWLEFAFCWCFDCFRDYANWFISWVRLPNLLQEDRRDICLSLDWSSESVKWSCALLFSINLLLSWQICCEDAVWIFLAPTENRQWKFYEKDYTCGNKHWEDKKYVSDKDFGRCFLFYELSSYHFCLCGSLRVRDCLVQQDCDGVWSGKEFAVLNIQNTALLLDTLVFFFYKHACLKVGNALSFCEVVFYYKVRISPFYASSSSVELFNSLRVIILLFLNSENGGEGNQI